MAEKVKKIIDQVSVIPQITLLLSQFLFLTVLASGFPLILGASLTTYERVLSPLYTEGSVSSVYD
tara:strand:+ start:211 stop:405 length:195 start_codon:yes stop_codon:yes gene_type:complete